MVGGALASAATGGPVLLGKSNSANKPTIVANTAAGAPLDLRAQAGQPPLKVNSNKLVAKLNADLVDGKSSSAFAVAGSSYTKAESDGKYPLATNVYTKAQSDGKYPLATNVYTKAESDTTFAAAANVYTKTQADGRFPIVLLSNSASGTSTSNADLVNVVDTTVAVSGPGMLVLFIEGKYTSGNGVTFRVFIEDLGNFRTQMGTNTTGSFNTTGHHVSAAGNVAFRVTMYSIDASPSGGSVDYTLLFVPD